MNSDLSLEFLRVVEQAAIGAGHTMGQGDRHKADKAAVSAMRRTLDTVADRRHHRHRRRRARRGADAVHRREGGEGGAPAGGKDGPLPKVDIAVDPLEGTNLCCTGASNALAVLAASDEGGLLHAPDLYMEKLVVGRDAKHAVFLDAPVAHNMRGIAKALQRRVEDLVDLRARSAAPRQLIADIRATGARIKLIRDGDLSAGIAAAVAGSGIHAVMGIGGAPEGVLTAAAMRCLNGEIFARLVVRTPEDEARCKAMGVTDLKRIYTSADLASCRFADFRGDRRHRRRPAEGRPLLRRRHAHQLGGDAEQAAAHPLHRHNPSPSEPRLQGTF